MDWDYYRDLLLSNLPGSKLASGGKEIICYCQNTGCDDHYKTSGNGHMYISIPQSNEEVSQFNCFKCGYKGVVTHEILSQWGIIDKELFIDISKHNQSVKRSHRPKMMQGINYYYLNNNFIYQCELSEYKLRYINNRLGANLSYQDILDLKICLNLYDLLNANNISELTRNEMITDSLNKYFLGFISLDNSYINMRKISDHKVHESIDKRYINYRIFKNAGRKNYVIPTSINTAELVKLHISEGPIDILSVFLNCRHCEPGIYCSITGNSYSDIINFILTNYMIPYCEIHIYPDNDEYGTNDYIRKQLTGVYDPYIPIYVHRNTFEGEKDFGVPASRINEKIIKLR